MWSVIREWKASITQNKLNLNTQTVMDRKRDPPDDNAHNSGAMTIMMSM